jgi:3-oxoacyl-[acyl-carrier protein] reductase
MSAMTNAGKKVALVTGGASGIGLAIVNALASDGFKVIIVDRAPTVQDTATQVATDCEGVSCELESSAQIADLHAYVQRAHGRCDVLVNNAGVHPKREREKVTLAHMDLESWNQVVAINLTAPFLLSKLFLPLMAAREWGRIINIASRAGRTLIPNCGAHYAATKAGLIGLTRVLAEEGAASNVTANTVAPGRISTPLSNHATERVLDNAMRAIPLGRVGHPDELAAAVRFLASEGSSYMTGAVLDVNGGSFMP